MLLHIPNLLSCHEVAEIRAQIAQMLWQKGQDSAGALAALVKDNLQLSAQDPQFSSVALRVQQRMAVHPLLQSAALPQHIVTPLLNCYQTAGQYAQHVDNVLIRDILNGQQYRADLSITVFLSNPDEYEGGELIIEDHYGEHEVKLDAGDAILYTSGSLHRVLPVTQGQRFAACTWIQSHVRGAAERQMLFDLDLSIMQLRQTVAEHDSLVKLTQLYHNLFRGWCQ